MECAEIREILPAYANGGHGSLAVRRHLSTCAACKAELARYESMSAALGELQASRAEVPASLERSLLSIPEQQGVVGTVRTHVARNRSVYARGAAVALAGVTGAALWRIRSRRVAAA
jgi:anti-sigma factor RsiW